MGNSLFLLLKKKIRFGYFCLLILFPSINKVYNLTNLAKTTMVNGKHGLNDFVSGEGWQTFQILLIENGIKELHDSYYLFDIHKMTRGT